jgi:hypothetical protein
VKHFEKIAKREGFVLTIVDTVTGNPRLMFALVKPGPPKPSRKPDPDDSHNWSKGWKTIP